MPHINRFPLLKNAHDRSSRDNEKKRTGRIARETADLPVTKPLSHNLSFSAPYRSYSACVTSPTNNGAGREVVGEAVGLSHFHRARSRTGDGRISSLSLSLPLVRKRRLLRCVAFARPCCVRAATATSCAHRQGATRSGDLVLIDLVPACSALACGGAASAS